MIRVGDALAQGTKAIQTNQVSKTPLLDASLLLSRITGLSREQLYAKSDVALSDEAVSQYHLLVSRRCEAVPIAYLTGSREFYGRDFRVTPDVLIPRPDTEILVEVALSFLQGKQNPEVLDLCTGSGCVGVSLGAERSDARITLADISANALEVARSNAQELLDNQPIIVQSDLFSELKGKRYTLIASNPPYLTESWYDGTEPHVKVEPELALLGGEEDGLAIIRRIVSEAPEHLQDGGALVVECDYRQVETVMLLLTERGFTEVGSESDLAQLERVVRGIWHV
ncbi:MAG TPA: peptide chain release factor N(5)-glutamine methyltransferase [Sphaerochaetaceae bacterium]|mgnify:CR=1 FL=1|nr:peptide chain release factor N(5)-glutamine methyltransferase [Sphaerochaetaceae bacterium]